jgi:hypothetical protein
MLIATFRRSQDFRRHLAKLLPCGLQLSYSDAAASGELAAAP